MKIDDKCKKDLLFYDELNQEDLCKIDEDSKTDLFFYYKNKIYNTSDFEMSTSEDYDEMLKIEDNKYLLLKYLDDDKVCIGVIK